MGSFSETYNDPKLAEWGLRTVTQASQCREVSIATLQAGTTPVAATRKLKQRRRRRQRERQKSNRVRLAKEQQSARASRFIVHFFAVAARLRRENAESEFTFCGERKHNDFLSPLLHFDTVFKKFQLQKRLPTFDELNVVE